MRPSLLACSGLLLFSPLLSRAQSPAAPASAPRFYVGLAAFHSNFQNVWSLQRSSFSGFRVPVQLTAGYQLRPRLALELGVAYSGSSTSFNDDGYYYNTGSAMPAYFQYNSTTTQRTANLSALARYRLTRQPEHRFQVDALGGFTLVHGSFYFHSAQTSAPSGSIQTETYDIRTSANEMLLTAGVGLRYRLTPRFELNFDIATNRNLNHPEVYNGFTGSAALGVRYRFGPS